MKVVKTFSRKVKTARRFVFENIMDLDHVCVVHRRWFRDLRIRAWRDDYVSYRLTSRFYGLRHDVEVQGGPVDEDRYWYEFNGAIARIRVDGVLTGPDGDLTQTETITYSFHWSAAPLFWLLGPLFRRQKDDILRDDTGLLERVHALDRSGFVRAEAKRKAEVVIYGGSGFFGRALVADLLEHTDASIVVASRNPTPIDFGPHASRVRFWLSDLADRSSVRSLIKDARIAICAAGPFQGMPLALLDACIESRVHYIDIADDRDFVERAYARGEDVERAGITAFVGCSVVPGMSAIMTRFALEQLPGASRVKICITPGTRNPRGAASFQCLLSTVGEEYTAPSGGSTRRVVGWSEREVIQYPAPLGRRSVYSVVDIADYFTQRHHFGLTDVTFKIGAELDSLNRLLTLFRKSKRLPGIRHGKALVPFFRRVIGLAALFGTTQGGVIVEVSTADSNAPTSFAIAITKERGGQVIPAILSSVATAMILGGELPTGLVPLPSSLPFHRFRNELERRGVVFSVRTPPGEWTALSGAREEDSLSPAARS